MSRATIIIRFTSYWLSGTGRAGSGDVDAVAHRDRFGCPALPMSQVKGQLRETAERLARIEDSAWTNDLVQGLFGTRPVDSTDHRRSTAARLFFRGDATISEARWFQTQPMARAQLFRRIASTRIGPNGAAVNKTLRAIEAAVPMTVCGLVICPEEDCTVDWVGLLDTACAATLAFGRQKNDGFGRAIARCKAMMS